MTEAAAIVHSAPAGAALAAPMKARAAMMRAQMEAETEIRLIVKEFVGRHMVEDTDYGVIPGTQKPTLLKPGAQKLITLFHCEPEYEVTNRVEDWNTGLFHYEVRCIIRERGESPGTGAVQAVGLGSANSREGRYRWRQGERACPECGQPTIIKGKKEYGGGYVCFKKKGGCGAKFEDGDQAIEEQPIGKVENDDICTLVNTILKMAKKRAEVDAAIALARCSDLFTQDVEDLVDSGHQVGDRQPSGAGKKQEPQQDGAPRFEARAKWAGSDDWAGKPLADAPVSVLEVYRDYFVEVHGRTEGAQARAKLQQHIDVVRGIIRDKAEAERADRPKPPLFAPADRYAWEYAEQWAGKSLADAPLDTLVLYGCAVQKALDAGSKHDKPVHQMHLRMVEDAIEAKEPPAESGASGDGFSLESPPNDVEAQARARAEQQDGDA